MSLIVWNLSGFLMETVGLQRNNGNIQMKFGQCLHLMYSGTLWVNNSTSAGLLVAHFVVFGTLLTMLNYCWSQLNIIEMDALVWSLNKYIQYKLVFNNGATHQKNNGHECDMTMFWPHSKPK